jgi:hypothetical protein
MADDGVLLLVDLTWLGIAGYVVHDPNLLHMRSAASCAVLLHIGVVVA